MPKTYTMMVKKKKNTKKKLTPKTYTMMVKKKKTSLKRKKI